jgi:UDP-N-acetylmuramate dehydrogenase
MMMNNLNRQLQRSVKGVISFDKSLKGHTAFKIGGVPRVWIEPLSLEDLKRALEICSKMNLKPFLIGGGSNLLVFDGKIDRAVIKLSAPSFKKMRFRGRAVTCGSGRNFSSFVKSCVEKGLSGPEKFAGIPGTVGGAITMNAGTGRESIGDLIKWVKVVNRKGKISVIERGRLRYGYRYSSLSKYAIVEAEFLLKRSDPRALRKEFKDRLDKKLKNQEYSAPNAGCIFKNPKDARLTSGQMLERCGVKGLRVGGAEVSSRHANFIINRGSASFEDVATLIRKVRRTVKKRFGISLESEIKIIK